MTHLQNKSRNKEAITLGQIFKRNVNIEVLSSKWRRNMFRFA